MAPRQRPAKRPCHVATLLLREKKTTRSNRLRLRLLVTVLEAILTCRQVREKLQSFCENLMSDNFRKTSVLKKI